MGFAPSTSPTFETPGGAHDDVLWRQVQQRGKIHERQLFGGLGNALGGALGGTVGAVKDLTSGLGLPCLIPGVVGNCPVASPALSSPAVVAPTSPRPATTPATTRSVATRPPVTAPSSPAPPPSSPPPATSAPAPPNTPSLFNPSPPNPSPTTAATSRGPVASSGANGGSSPGTVPSPTSPIAESQVVPSEPTTTFVLSTVVGGETVAFSTATLTGTSAIAVASSLLATDAVITTTDAQGQAFTLSGSAASSILASSLSSLLSEATVVTSAGFVTTTDSRGRITTSFRSARPTSSGEATAVKEVEAAAAADRTRSILIGVFVSIFVVGIALALLFLWGRRRRAKANAALPPGSSIRSHARLFPEAARPRPTFLGLPVSFNPSRNRNVAASIQSGASSTYGTSIISSDSVESQFEIRSYHRDGSPYEGNSSPPARFSNPFESSPTPTPTPATVVNWQRESSSSSSGEGTVRPVDPVWSSASALQHSDSDLPYASRALGSSTNALLSPHLEDSLVARSLQPPFRNVFPSRPRPTPPPRSPLRPPFTVVPIRIEEEEPRTSCDKTRTSCDTRSQSSFKTAASRLGTASGGSLDGDSEEEDVMDPAHDVAPRLRLEDLAQTSEDPFVERTQRRWQASASGYWAPQDGGKSSEQDRASGAGFVQRHPFIKPRAVSERKESMATMASEESGLGSILREFPTRT